MTSNYPEQFDVLDENLREGLVHEDVAAAVANVQTTLGLNPQGPAATVALRFSDVERNAQDYVNGQLDVMAQPGQNPLPQYALAVNGIQPRFYFYGNLPGGYVPLDTSDPALVPGTIVWHFA